MGGERERETSPACRPVSSLLRSLGKIFKQGFCFFFPKAKKRACLGLLFSLYCSAFVLRKCKTLLKNVFVYLISAWL